MPFRRLPNTDDSRFCALQACQLKADGTDAAAWLISSGNYTTLSELFGQFKDALGTEGSDLREQTKSTEEANIAFNITRQLVSHFIQTFNMAVDRHVFPASDRAFYKLDVNQASLPSLASEADVMLWAQRVIDGEAERVKKGGKPIPFPSIAEVSTAFEDFKGKSITQGQRSEKVDDDIAVIVALRPQVDALILDLWDEVEFNLRRLPAPSLRAKARDWGVIYDTRPGEQPDAPTPTAPTTPAAPTK